VKSYESDDDDDGREIVQDGSDKDKRWSEMERDREMGLTMESACAGPMMA
jgi:hypothetical protein